MGVVLATQLSAAAVLGSRAAGWLQPAELASYDALVRWTARGGEARHVAAVLAREEDIERFGWPLSDRTMAELAQRILDTGASAVAFDIYRDRPVGEGAASFTELLHREGRIVWVYRLGEAGHPGVQPPPALAGTGRAAFADVVADPGEVVRRALIAATDPADGRTAVSLGTALALKLAGTGFVPAGGNLRLGSGVLRIIDLPFGPYADIDAAGYQVLLSLRGAVPVLSISDVMDGRAALLAGRGVLVGVNALSVGDSFTTPLTTGLSGGRPLPGVLIHAHLAEQLLRTAAGEAPVPAPLPTAEEGAGVWLAAVLGGIVPALAPPAAWVASVALGAGLALAAVGVAAAWGFAAGVLLPAVPAALAFVLAAAAATALLHGAGHRQRQLLRRAFESYLDPTLVRRMVNAGQVPGLGGEQRVVTAMFTDIAGFTTMAEHLPPPRLSAILNDYFEGMCAAVVAQGGFVVDYIGDAVFALFGAPLDQPDHAERAVEAALAADDFACAFAARLHAEGVAFGHTRIGVHTGLAVVGNMGTRTRLKYGATGDTLNLAARLESLNRWTGTRVLVSDATAALDRRHAFALVGEVAVVGRQARTAVFVPRRPDGGDPYGAAIAALRAGDAAAAHAALDALEEQYRDDPVAAFHRRRLADGVCSLLIVPGGK